ncbi:DUF5623 domain-containing protein [Agrobacterium sp. 10MFCol1.1]|uniref:DUF5623 domain-containing protein n=1 Tax=Agrobacterium sp. 10MFCol1.1 TaxID=1150775 RepID=UPI0003705BA0|nr:DUF5623 domain-containing protein [Agrobacterium sp. 10MFCol1.1]
MLIENIHPKTLDGVKRLATQLKKSRGIKHSDALDLAAQAANFTNFRHALRTLPVRGPAFSNPYVLLTVYWRDEVHRHLCGRETLKIDLSRPILEICKKSALKHVRGFTHLRMVADDHFVCDEIAHSQDYARERLCTSERSLRFMEHTGLQPSRDLRKLNTRGLDNEELPYLDHPTDWVDPASGQYFLIDEPYANAPNEAKRPAWAARNGWRVEKTSWPGMYRPYVCDLYVAVDNRCRYDIDALVEKINAMGEPLTSERWIGESSPLWDTFLSPMAISKQDKRRARCKGMIYPSASKVTVPYNYAQGTARRRPVGALGIEGHIEAGRIIKAALRSRLTRSGVYTRLGSLRSELENWLSLEIGRGQLDGPEFFDVYYRETSADEAYKKTLKSADDIVTTLELRKPPVKAASLTARASRVGGVQFHGSI